MASAVRDWTGRWVGSSPALVYPSSTEQVAAVVNWCREHSIAIVPQGGNTGMVGGSVPLDNEIVLNLTRMAGVEVDRAAGHLTAHAGATLASVQQAAAEAGWRYCVDLGARDSATIGGTVATNAGGTHVLRYGDTRRQLLGIEAVTGNGEVVGDLRGLEKDNTGYHLPSLLAGSEGTLAVVTRVCLRLAAPPSETAVALVGFPSEKAAIDAVSTIRLNIGDLEAVELFFADGLGLVREQFELPNPLPDEHAAYMLIEVAGTAGLAERLAAALSAAELRSRDVAIGLDRGQRERLWRYREAHSEAIARIGVPHKLDVTVPLSSMAAFIQRVRSTVTAHNPDATTWLFGHAADGNLHVNITGADPTDTDLDKEVLMLVASLGGSISAEHGIGRAKASHLHLNRTTDELALARRIKTAFDPAGILNPAILLN